MSPRDLARQLGKDEADVVRRLRNMQKFGLVHSSWGTRLGKNVKVYSLATSGFEVGIRRDGITIEFDHAMKGTEKPPAIFSESIEESLPAIDVTSIHGRRQELNVLHDNSLDFIFVVGVAGIGKTSLAKKFVSEYLAGPSGHLRAASPVFWHTFKEIDTIYFLLGKIAAFLSVRGSKDLIQHLEQQSGTETFGTDITSVTISALDKLSALVLVFDDYHKIKDEKILGFIKGLLDRIDRSNKTVKSKVIVLSRYEPPFYFHHPNCKEMKLSGLPLKDAQELIYSHSQSMDSQTLEEAWKRYGGHPMALKIFSLFTKGTGKGVDMNREWLHGTGSLAELLTYFQREIFNILDEDELNLLTRLSVFRTPVGYKAFQDGRKLSGRRNLNYLLHSLQKKMLIIVDASKHEISLHDTLRDSVYSMLMYPAELHALAARYYVEKGDIASIVESIYHLTRCGRVSEIMRILEDEIVNEKYHIIENGYARPLLGILESIDLTSRDKLESEELVYLRSIQAKGLAMIEQWDESERKLQDAISLAHRLGDRSVMAYVLKNYGEIAYLQNKLNIVEEKLLAAASIFERLGNKDNDYRSLNAVYLKLARLYFITGKHDKSRAYSEKAKTTSLRH